MLSKTDVGLQIADALLENGADPSKAGIGPVWWQSNSPGDVKPLGEKRVRQAVCNLRGLIVLIPLNPHSRCHCIGQSP